MTENTNRTGAAGAGAGSGLSTYPPTPNDWRAIGAALFAGVTAAMQIGKASAALPLLRADFGAGVAEAAFYLGLFSLGAALFGALVGIAAFRIGPLRAGAVGLVCIGIGSLAGAAAETWPILLVGRLAEAVGLPLIVAAMPALIHARSDGAARVFALGLWSTWLPAGVAAALALSVATNHLVGWRGLYVACGLLPLLALLPLLLFARPGRDMVPRAEEHTADIALPGLGAFRRADTATLTVALVFALFQGAYLTMQGFLPSVALETLGMPIANANVFGGLAAILVIPGNLVASLLLSQGAPARLLLGCAFTVMGLAAACFLSSLLPPATRILSGCLFTLAAGAPPAVLWGLIPRLSDRSGLSGALTSGILYQGAGLGQLLGPVIAGIVIQHVGGWAGGALVVCAFAAVAVMVLAARPAFPWPRSGEA